MKTMLIGSVDLSGKTIGGQYEKTRLVYNFLRSEKDINVYFCNMFDVGKTLRLLAEIIRGYSSCDNVVVITSTRGTKVISKILYCLRKIKQKTIVYLIVGNQQDLLKSFSNKMANSIDKLYFEVDCMKEELKDKYNVGLFSNCKDIYALEVKQRLTDQNKICYYSEISFRKGFDRIVRALDVLNQDKIKYRMDVYGYYADDETDMEKYFDSRSFLQFKGVIKRENSREMLSQYNFMVFPSRHKLEGVPGAIVDAYEAGLPVICSDVGFLSHVVKDKQTGYIFKDETELISLLEEIYSMPSLIDDLRNNALQEAKIYDIKNSIKRLHADLIELGNR